MILIMIYNTTNNDSLCAVLQGDVYGYKHALAISQYDVEDTPMRDRERVSGDVPYNSRISRKIWDRYLL